MPWEASTEFEGVRPPGFPGSIPVDGGSGCPGWLPAPVPAATSTFGRAWSRLPWEPSNLSDNARQIREQGGWGRAAFGEACAALSRQYALLTINGTASRLAATGSCAGQIDDQRVATDWVETWDWEFRTTADDPETEEIDETAYEVIIEADTTGTFQRTTNTLTPSGGSCIVTTGIPVDVAPPAASAPVSGTNANWAYPSVAGFTPSGEIAYALSEEITTTTMATLLDEWLLQSDAFRAATGGNLVIHQTQSPDAAYGRVARGTVRFSLLADIPAGYKAVVDYVIRESRPIDRLSFTLPDVLWHTGTGTLTLSDLVTTSADSLGTWTRGAITQGDVDAAPWALNQASSLVTASGTGTLGDCGLAVRVVSLAPGRRFRVACTMDWSGEAGPGEVDFSLDMDEEEGEPNRTPTVYWEDHAPAEVYTVGFRILTDPGDIEEWNGTGWVDVPTEGISAAVLAMKIEARIRGGGPWGFRNFDPSTGDPATPAWYSKAVIDLTWQITGTNPDTCGDDPSGSLTLLGELNVDAAGRYTDAITTDTATFGGLSYNPDNASHPDARHPWYQPEPSYLLYRLPLETSSDTPTEADLPPPQEDGPGDPFDQGVEIKRDLPDGWGDEISRTPIDLVPAEDPETESTWVTPPAWPGAGQFATWENLRYEPAD